MEMYRSPTIIDLFKQWRLQFLESKDSSKETIRLYQNAIASFLDWLKVLQVEKPEQNHIILWKEHIKSTRSLGTAQTYLTAVKQFFKYLGKRDFYPDIASDIRRIRTGVFPKRDYLTAWQILSVLETAKKTTNGCRNYAIILLMTTCGLRVSEVARANIEDFCRSGGSLVLFIHGKGRDGKTEFVTVPEATALAVSQYLNTREVVEAGTPLFLSQGGKNRNHGQRLSSRQISRLIKQTFLKCGLESSRLTAHSLRHTAITLSLQGGSSLQEAQQFARHSLITTTQIYAHNLEQVKNPCADRVADMLFHSRFQINY